MFSYKKVVRVTILSGQHLPSSEKKGDVVDPYIQFKVRGHPDDKQKQRTKTVKNNGKKSSLNVLVILEEIISSYK